MSVVSWDARFGLKQDELARNGFVRKAGETVSKMTKDEYNRFMHSPAMSASDRFREVCGARTSLRDRKRMETDPSFRPGDADWAAKKSFEFNKRIDYYRVLGVDEYEPQEGIKKAYRQLSLVYHPDKTAGMSEVAAAEYQQIFIEIKNAYLVLHDHPTRRQYDKARDDAVVADELFGHVKKKKEEAQFDAFRALELLAASKPKPSAVVTVYVPVKLEKMFNGGIKPVWGERRRQLLDGWVQEEQCHKVLVPRLCPERHPYLRKAAGDHHEKQRPDHLSFRICAKQHPRIVREGIDMRLRSAVRLPAGALADPYVSAEVESLGGRVLLLFGRNPFHGLAPSASRRRVRVAVVGEGFDSTGRFRFDVDYPMEASSSSLSSASAAAGGGRPLRPPLAARARSRTALPVECDAELAELRRPLTLGTSPSCTLHFYGNLSQPVAVESGGPGLRRERPRPLFAVVLSCPLAAKRRFAKEWQRLRNSLLPLLWVNFWMLVPPMRRLHPRHLDSRAACEEEEGEEEADRPGAAAAALRPEAEAEADAEVLPGPDVAAFLRRFRLGPPGGLVELRPCWAAAPAAETPARAAGYEAWRLYPRAPARPSTARRRPSGGERSADPRAAALASPAAEASWRLRLADRAFAQGFYWLARNLYSEAAAAAGADAGASACNGGALGDGAGCALDGDEDAAGLALVRRSDCYARLRDFEAARADARQATALTPRCAGAWRQLGALEARLGDAAAAHSALLRAVALGGQDQVAVEMLQKLQVTRRGDPDLVALAAKAAGNAAFVSDPAEAVAHYTSALAALGIAPAGRLAGSQAVASGGERGKDVEVELGEERVRLVAELLCNRAGASTRLGGAICWAAARRDAEQAVALPGREAWSVARLRLGTALLGEGRYEEAYPHFARAAAALPAAAPPEHAARRGLASCLALAGGWSSVASRFREERGHRDAYRKPAATRVFAISDIHFDHPLAEDWVDRISDSKFQEDVLVVAGDVAETLAKVRTCLRHLRAKFRRVFYTPGNHDLWVNSSEDRTVVDSIHKLFCLMEVCHEEDVDVFPADICEGLSIVPLFSWYNVDFDLDDPFPSEAYGFDKHCKWPMDQHSELWRYMLYLNRRLLEWSCQGTLITFSHFLPRHELPFWHHVPGLVKAVGCPQLDEQVRQAGSACHVFGHSHLPCNVVIDGVRYVQNALGYKGEHGPEEPLMCIYDGSRGGLIAERRDLSGRCL